MENVLVVDSLTAGYQGEAVVRDVSFTLHPNEILAIVGESGCGKSTLLKSIFPIRGMKVEKLQGTVTFGGVDVGALTEGEKRELLGQRISYIFQNPESSLHPTRRIGVQIEEAVGAHQKLEKKEILALVEEVFSSVGLTDVERVWQSYPFELSGGMAQRVAIAISVLLKPALILADEPTSALDASIQKQVIEELLKFREQLGTGMVVITHNMGVASKLADTIGVMYAGRMIEYGPVKKVLENPKHPYTKALLLSVPKLGGVLPVGLEGAPPHFKDLSGGCAFIDRCPKREKICESYDNQVHLGDDGRRVLCCLGGLE